MEVRLLTYNAHGCVGTDGVRDPARIALVIAEARADVVALQELDVGRRRSARVDQAAEIAARLEMQHHFAAAREIDDGHYGNAIVSRWPLRLVRAGALPGLPRRETRGALWAALSLPTGDTLQVITTHLGLRARERRAQVAALIGEEWLAGFTPPGVLCGDLNSPPWSSECKRFGDCLRRARSPGWRPDGTFPAWLPLLPIDHVFATPDVEVLRVEPWATPLARRASDHLPLAVTLRV